MKNRNQHYSSGFTLIELVVAMAVFAIMAAIAYSGLNNVLLAKEQTDEHAKQLYHLQLTMNWIARDIQQAVDRGIRDEYGAFLAPFIGNDFEGYPIELTRGGWRNPANQTRSHLQRVAYFVKEEKLLRAYWRVLDRAEDSKPYESVLLEGVTGMEIRYLDLAGEWHTSWPAHSAGITNQPVSSIPRAVEVNVDTKQFGKITRLFRPGI